MKNFLEIIKKPFRKFLARQMELGKIERELRSQPIEKKTFQDSKAEQLPDELIKAYNRRQKSKRNNIFWGVALLIFVIYLFGSFSTSKTSNNSYESNLDVAVDSSWVPTEFNTWSEDSNVAWRWLESNEYKCDYDRACTGIMIIAKNGCDRNLYAEVSLLDKNDVQIGYTNDTVSSALPMQKSKLIFNTYEEGADSVRVSKISCY
jgi:hypothetical protein